MKLSEVKELLPNLENVAFKLENNTSVPEHFHVTKIGIITKKFIDCGGTIRTENKVSFQLWDANDFEHRLKPSKLLNIIQLSEKQLDIEDEEIEVEYQNTTIGKYDLAFDGTHFILQNKTTACLAQDNCGIPNKKENLKLSELQSATQTCCSPGSKCN